MHIAVELLEGLPVPLKIGFDGRLDAAVKKIDPFLQIWAGGSLDPQNGKVGGDVRELGRVVEEGPAWARESHARISHGPYARGRDKRAFGKSVVLGNRGVEPRDGHHENEENRTAANVHT
jgi:hypothetical protein